MGKYLIFAENYFTKCRQRLKSLQLCSFESFGPGRVPYYMNVIVQQNQMTDFTSSYSKPKFGTHLDYEIDDYLDSKI